MPPGNRPHPPDPRAHGAPEAPDPRRSAVRRRAEAAARGVGGTGGGAARVQAPGAARRGAGIRPPAQRAAAALQRSEEHTSELQSLMRISYAVFCLKKKTKHTNRK